MSTPTPGSVGSLTSIPAFGLPAARPVTPSGADLAAWRRLQNKRDDIRARQQHSQRQFIAAGTNAKRRAAADRDMARWAGEMDKVIAAMFALRQQSGAAFPNG